MMKIKQISKHTSALVLVSLMLISLPHLGWSQAQNWQFDVWVDERMLGTHSFDLAPLADDGYQIASRADLEARILFIKAFDYQHRSDEIYKQGCLQQLRSNTVSGAERYQVAAVTAADTPQQGLRITTNSNQQDLLPSQNLSGCLMSFAYWDRRMLTQTQLINSQTGQLTPVVISKGVADEYAGVDAQSYELTSVAGSEQRMLIRIWYERNGLHWIGLESLLDNGKTLRYVLQRSRPVGVEAAR